MCDWHRRLCTFRATFDSYFIANLDTFSFRQAEVRRVIIFLFIVAECAYRGCSRREPRVPCLFRVSGCGFPYRFAISRQIEAAPLCPPGPAWQG